MPLGHDHQTQIFRVQTGTCIIMVHGLSFSGERDVCKNSMKDSSQIIMLTTNKHYKGPRGGGGGGGGDLKWQHIYSETCTHAQTYIYIYTHTHGQLYAY